MSICRQNKS